MFLAGAASRLLPVSIPFRFFGAAISCHLLGWLALLAGARQFPRFAGGPGWNLAALHLMTLGVLVMTAIGASLQLLPVATRQPVWSARWPALVWWLYAPGVVLLTLGMASAAPWVMGVGASAVLVALLVYALLLASNLRGARGMPAVVAHGWAALACLLLLLASAVSLVLAYLGLPVLDRPVAVALHLAFAAYGFMGLLSLGMSYILVPMFALSATPNERNSIASCLLAAAALVLAGLAAFGVAPQALRVLAIAVGGLAVALHLLLMRKALRSGMRRMSGASFMLVRVGWASLAGSLVAGLAVVLDAPLAGLPTLFGLMLVGGWLLSFLLGILRRILPFLASMHVPRGSKRPPTPASLSAELPLFIHFHCHLVALGGLALAVLADSGLLAALAAFIGVVGAAAFGAFFVILVRRMRAAVSPPPAGNTHGA